MNFFKGEGTIPLLRIMELRYIWQPDFTAIQRYRAYIGVKQLDKRRIIRDMEGATPGHKSKGSPAGSRQKVVDAIWETLPGMEHNTQVLIFINNRDACSGVSPIEVEGSRPVMAGESGRCRVLGRGAENNNISFTHVNSKT
jgi:hypothetical protein